MPVQTLTNLVDALRFIYSEGVVPQLNDNRLARKLRKKYVKDLNLQGRGAVIVIDGSRAYGSVMSTGEDGTLAVAGRHTPKQLIVPFRALKGRIGISWETIKATQSNKAAAVDALEYERKRLVEDMERQMNRIFWGYGAGILAVISAGATSTAQTVKDAGNVLNAQSSTNNPARYIAADMVVALQTGATINSIGTVSSVAQSTGTVTFSASQTTTTGDTLYLGTSQTANNSAKDKEPMGLLGLVDASTYLSTIFSFDRTATANTFFQSGVQTSVGVLSEDFLLRQIHDRAIVTGYTKKINQWYGGPDVLREYIKLSQPDRRYNTDGKAIAPDVGVPNAGLEDDLLFCGKPITVDADAPYGHLFGVNTDHLYFTYLSEGEWENPMNDGEIVRFAADRTNYESILIRTYNFCSDRGNVHLRLSGITSTVSSSVVAD